MIRVMFADENTGKVEFSVGEQGIRAGSGPLYHGQAEVARDIDPEKHLCVRAIAFQMKSDAKALPK